MKKGKSCYITNVPPDLWNEFRSACAHYGLTIRGTLINYMQNIVEDYLKDRSVSDKLKIKTEKGGKK